MEIQGDWPKQLPTEFYAGLDELNRAEYYACHETLEALWIPERRSVREIYQGVLQIAVGCFHLTVRANWVGAVNKLDAGARRLERAGLRTAPTDPSPRGREPGEEPGLYGVDWISLITAADHLQAHLRELGRAEVARFDRALLPAAHYRRAGRAGER